VNVVSDPPVPGLAYSVELSWSEPWPPPSTNAAGALEVDVPALARLGRPVDLPVRAAAPGGAPLELLLALPFGLVVDRPHLDALPAQGTITSYELREGVVVLRAPRRAQGSAFATTLPCPAITQAASSSRYPMARA
jgi:hypothetical protein